MNRKLKTEDLQALVSGFFGNEDGATSIEYAMIASLLSVGILGALIALGDSNNGMFAFIASKISPALTDGF